MAREYETTDDTGATRSTRDDRTMTDGNRHRTADTTTGTATGTMRDDRAVRTDRDRDGKPDEVDLRDREHRTEVARDHVHRQHEFYGGFKWGAAFFGWLSAIGFTVLLLAIASAAG